MYIPRRRTAANWRSASSFFSFLFPSRSFMHATRRRTSGHTPVDGKNEKKNTNSNEAANGTSPVKCSRSRGCFPCCRHLCKQKHTHTHTHTNCIGPCQQQRSCALDAGPATGDRRRLVSNRVCGTDDDGSPFRCVFPPVLASATASSTLHDHHPPFFSPPPPSFLNPPGLRACFPSLFSTPRTVTHAQAYSSRAPPFFRATAATGRAAVRCEGAREEVRCSTTRQPRPTVARV